MGIRVGDLVSQLRDKSRVVSARLGEVELVLGDEGEPSAQLRVGDEFLPWGDRNTRVVAGFIKGPGYKYLEREPLDWQRQVVRHHTRQNSDADTLWYIEGNSVSGIYFPDTKILPLVAIAERIANVFDPDDQAEILLGPDQAEINVTSHLKTVTVPGIPGVDARPMDGTVDHPDGRKVGDLSAGGIRIIVQPNKPERAPVVEEFWERLVCLNGLCRRVAGSQITLRGRTVEQILDELENVARVVFEGLEASAQAILHSAETPIPGAVSDFMRVVARERRINAATVMRLQERVATLHADPSVYDVTQIITELANDEGLPVVTRRNLQAIGGDLTIDTKRMVHRCASCERPLERSLIAA